MIFYVAPFSTASVTEAVLAELGTPHERVELDIDAGDTRAPQFLAVNPNGRVPAIVDEGVAIWESSAITLYLGERDGVALGLYPPPGPKRGEAMKWIVWASATLGVAAGRLSAVLPTGAAGAVQAGSVDFIEPELHPASELTEAKADVARQLSILDAALEGRDYVLGDYSLADTQIAVLTGWIASMQVDLVPFPNLSAWLARCGQRPALAALFAD